MVGAEISLSELRELWTLYIHTRQVFQSYLDNDGELENNEIAFLATTTLSHIDDIEHGFKWSLKMSDLPRDELPYVLMPEDKTDWTTEPGGPPQSLVHADMHKVLALRHAQVVFGFLPMTPRALVSYPGFASYSDIRRPRTPLELRERINELAAVVWSAASKRAASQLDPERARRVYGFFEAGSWLTSYHIRKVVGN